MIFALLIFGTCFLYLGAEGLVKGASRLGLSFGLSPLVVGLTVVAIGTSMPELVASLIAVVKEGSGDIALGNVIGSNIFNKGFILGSVALLHPLKISPMVRMHDAPVMVVTALALLIAMLPLEISRPVAALFLAAFLLYIYYRIKIKDPNVQEVERHEALLPRVSPFTKELIFDLLLAVCGIAFLVIGGFLFIEGAVRLAKLLGVSDRVIGLTIVAMGTSLPEFATSIVAALRGHFDIAVGNVVGSNIFNVLFIVGVVGVVHPFTFSHNLLYWDAPVMAGFSVLLWSKMLHHLRLERSSGALFLSLYILYIFSLLVMR